MEIIEESSLKTKALVIILIIATIFAISTLFCTVNAAEEPKLNTKIEFTGKTYKYPNQDKVRKEYAEGEKGCGIVSIISKRAKHTVYVTGEGWIDIDQIVEGSATKYIDLIFPKLEDLKNGDILTRIRIDGEFVDVVSDNAAVISYKDGMLTVIGNGKSDVVITTKEGKEINALATVVDGALTLSIPDKALVGELSATAEIAEKVTIEANGGAGVALDIDSEGVSVVGEANGDVTIKAEEKEIASATGNVTGDLNANKEGITANVNAEQTMSILQRLTMKLSERAEAAVNKEETSVSASGDAAVNDKELASGDAALTYDYSDKELYADAEVEVLEKSIFNVERVPLISRLKSLISRLKTR